MSDQGTAHGDRPSSVLTVNVEVLLHFFDERPRSSEKHATAVAQLAGEDLGLALLLRYLEGRGLGAEVLRYPCTQGTQKGVRLDGWVAVESVPPKLYQVEVKSWSAHAIGGKRLLRAATEEEQRQYRIARWEREWDGRGFRNEAVQKVLKPMKAPRSGYVVEPLVVFWTAMHPDGEPQPLFDVPLYDCSFPKVSVFSQSTYLRGLGRMTIDLPMPRASARIDWLHQMFNRGGSTE